MLVSVIIPSYNAEKTLAGCVKSVMEQSLALKNYEIIVVDNGSTDQTKSIIKKFPVKYIYESYPSVYRARNKGVNESSGEIIAFIDSDCIADRNWLVNGLILMQSFKIGSGMVLPQLSSNRLLYLYDKIIRWVLPYKSTPYINILAGNAFIERKLFNIIGGFNDKLTTAGDSILSILARQKGYQIGFSTESIVYHPVDPIKKRFHRFFREGNGSSIKDIYKHKLIGKQNKYKIIKNKTFNFIKGFSTKLMLVCDARKNQKISYLEMLMMFSLVIFFTVNEYTGVFIAYYFKNLNNKLAGK